MASNAEQNSKLTQFLDQFLVLVEFLQSFGIHTWDVVGLGLITMLLITKDADGHLRAGDVPQPVNNK